jgi:heparan-alpha-glucosaminide N-acetyltransferase
VSYSEPLGSQDDPKGSEYLTLGLVAKIFSFLACNFGPGSQYYRKTDREFPDILAQIAIAHFWRLSMSPAAPDNPVRILSLDALRGFVMFLMMDSAFRVREISRSFPDSEFWSTLKFHTDHVAWTGCSLHDLIQPAFSFLVGASLPFSIANREAHGQGFPRMLLHAIFRGGLLMFLGIFLRSMGRPQTNWTFMDTLTQIGMGYVILFLLAYLRTQLVLWLSLGLILIGYWFAFASYPLPSSDFDYAAVNVKPGEPGRFDGFMAHWDKNANLAADFDRRFLNEFPRKTEFRYERSGYTTLNFIPTLGTMILGVIAGMWLRTDWSPRMKFMAFLIAGLAGIALGEASEDYGICPVVKIIWTPAWVLYSGGWTFLLLAGFYLVIDMIGFWRWSYPLLVIGANSIVAYIAYHTILPFISGSYRTHFGPDAFKYRDEYWNVQWEPMITGVVVLLTLWLILLWMYRNKIFVRI